MALLSANHIFQGDGIMKLKSGIALVASGVGGALLYQQMKNGNVKKWVREMNRAKTKAIDDLEDMI